MAANDSGIDYIGADINESVIAQAQAAGGGRFFHIYEISESFSCVTAFDSIEHFEKLNEFCSTVESHLLPGGHLLVTTPNFGSRWIRIFGDGWHGFGIPQYHRYIFSARAISILLQQHGYRVVTTFSVPPIENGGWKYLLSSGYRQRKSYRGKLTALPWATIRFIYGKLLASGEDDTLCVVAQRSTIEADTLG